MRNQVLYGLQNIGNTCFLNAVLHLIKHIDIIMYELICRESDNEFVLKIALFYRVLFNRSLGRNELISFHRFLSKHIILENIPIQGDSNEVLISLISKLTDYNKTLDRVLRSTVINEVTCNNCGNISRTKNNSYCLNYTVPQNKGDIIDLRKLINIYSENNELFGDNSYKCEKCNKLTNATKCSKINKYAHILIMNIDRHIHNINGNSKNSSKISFKKNMLLNNRTYYLIGTIYHLGNSMSSGHYICKVYDFNSYKWYIYNDSNVSVIEEKIEEISNNNYSHIYISDKMYNLCNGKIKESLIKKKWGK